MDQKKGAENGSRVCEPAETKEKAAEEGGTRGERIQLEPSGTSGLCLGITRHPCDKTHAVFVRQPSAAEKADKAISGIDVPTEWHNRTNRAVFTWQEPRRKGGTVSYKDRKSTWNSGVRKAIRRGLQKRRCASTGIL